MSKAVSAGASLVHKAAGTYRGAVETLLEPVFRYVRPGLVYVLGVPALILGIVWLFIGTATLVHRVRKVIDRRLHRTQAQPAGTMANGNAATTGSSSRVINGASPPPEARSVDGSAQNAGTGNGAATGAGAGRSPGSEGRDQTNVGVRSNRSTAASEKSSSKRRHRTVENRFEMRASRLDTHGELLKPWRTPRAHERLPAPDTCHDLTGWYNMMVVVLFSYIVSNAIHACYSQPEGEPGMDVMSCFNVSRIFLDRGHAFLTLFTQVPALFRDLAILFTFYACFTYGYQLAATAGRLRGRTAVALQTVAELSLFLGMVAYARSGAISDWPVLQRLALLMEATVLTMKMHSYIVVNRHLAREVAMGGPGTGEKVMQAAAVAGDALLPDTATTGVGTASTGTQADGGVAGSDGADAPQAASMRVLPAGGSGSSSSGATTPQTASTTTTSGTSSHTATPEPPQSAPAAVQPAADGLRRRIVPLLPPIDRSIPQPAVDRSSRDDAEHQRQPAETTAAAAEVVSEPQPAAVEGLLPALKRAFSFFNRHVTEESRVQAVEAAARRGRASGSSIDIRRQPEDVEERIRQREVSLCSGQGSTCSAADGSILHPRHSHHHHHQQHAGGAAARTSSLALVQPSFAAQETRRSLSEGGVGRDAEPIENSTAVAAGATAARDTTDAIGPPGGDSTAQPAAAAAAAVTPAPRPRPAPLEVLLQREGIITSTAARSAALQQVSGKSSAGEGADGDAGNVASTTSPPEQEIASQKQALPVPEASSSSSFSSTVPAPAAPPKHRRGASGKALELLAAAATPFTRASAFIIRGTTSEGRETTLASVSYPHNVNLKDFAMYSMAPTLCYEPNYPRTTTLDVGYLAEKVFLAAGLVAAGVYVTANYIQPVMPQLASLPFLDAIAQLMLPITSVVLIVFFVAFECVLNACAEMTYFADRAFYDDWYNATSFAEFSRKWNKPVHEWLLRHVYLDLMRRRTTQSSSSPESSSSGGGSSGTSGSSGDGGGGGGGLSPTLALYATYLLSIAAHEIVLWGAMGWVTPYLAVLSTLQFPLMSILRMPFFKGKRLGNIFFWFGLMLGVTMAMTLYATEYCEKAW